jgi:hypothetical protein
MPGLIDAVLTTYAKATAVKAAEEVFRVLKGQAPRNAVNPEVLKSAVTA